MYDRIREVLQLTRKKLRLATRFYTEGDMEECIHYIWLVFENSINIIKDVLDNKPVFEHKTKQDFFSLYHELGFLARDYSESFAMLEKLRIRADFGPYSQTPSIPRKGKVNEYLHEAKQLLGEAENRVKKARHI